jgi:hypothetical protein
MSVSDLNAVEKSRFTFSQARFEGTINVNLHKK